MRQSSPALRAQNRDLAPMTGIWNHQTAQFLNAVPAVEVLALRFAVLCFTSMKGVGILSMREKE